MTRGGLAHSQRDPLKRLRGGQHGEEMRQENVNGGSVLFKDRMRSSSAPSDAWTPLYRSLGLGLAYPAGCFRTRFCHPHHCPPRRPRLIIPRLRCETLRLSGIRLAQKHRLSPLLLFSLRPGIIKFVYYSITPCSFCNVTYKSQFIK